MTVSKHTTWSSFKSEKSVSSISSDPTISAQNDSNNMESQWSFEILNPDVAGKTTFWLTTYYFVIAKYNMKGIEF